MRCRLILAVAACMAVPAWLSSQSSSQPSSPLPREITLRVDNDAFNFWIYTGLRSDDDYTSGVRIVVDNGWLPWWRKHLWSRLPRCTTTLTDCVAPRAWIGQDIYNPERDAQQNQRPGTMPNAGWLYYTEELRRTDDNTFESLTTTYGITGPPALGKVLQDYVHSRAPRLNRPTDWSTQIQFEPGLDARYERESMLLAGTLGPVGAQLLPSATASVGNVLTEATAGLRTRFGLSLDNPWLPAPAHAAEIAFTAGVTGHAVAHDLFLDGNTFRKSPSVARVPFYSEQTIGVSVRYGWLHGGYDIQWDGKKYENGRPHIWSSMTGGVVFSP